MSSWTPLDDVYRVCSRREPCLVCAVECVPVVYLAVCCCCLDEYPDTGEFRWIPAFEACGDKEKAKRIVEVLKKIPADRRAVWAQRLDLEEAKITCPVISKEVDLCKDFDDLCAAYSKPVGTRPNEKHEGGESRNE